jgi:hypothetical protein
MALAIRNRERVTAESVPARDGEDGGRIEAATEENDS